VPVLETPASLALPATSDKPHINSLVNAPETPRAKTWPLPEAPALAPVLGVPASLLPQAIPETRQTKPLGETPRTPPVPPAPPAPRAREESPPATAARRPVVPPAPRNAESPYHVLVLPVLQPQAAPASRPEPAAACKAPAPAEDVEVLFLFPPPRPPGAAAAPAVNPAPVRRDPSHVEVGAPVPSRGQTLNMMPEIFER
jgi:hypothetical protein